MLITRLAKIVMCLALGLFCLLAAFDNVTDYSTNYLFVQHVLSMDTTLPGNSLKYRAITSPVLWQQAYAAIIAAESLARLLFVVGAVVLCAYGLRPLLLLIMRRAMRLQAPRLHSSSGSLASWSSVASGSPCGNRQLGTAKRPPSASTWRRSRCSSSSINPILIDIGLAVASSLAVRPVGFCTCTLVCPTRRGHLWWARQDSNLEPDGYEPSALTIELRAHAALLISDVTP